MKIGIISDTHNFLPDTAERYLKKCDEIWHAGDIGSLDLLNKIKNISFTRAVSGNIARTRTGDNAGFSGLERAASSTLRSVERSQTEPQEGYALTRSPPAGILRRQ